jgi:predicted SAM-dependent methyltransferase
MDIGTACGYVIGKLNGDIGIDIRCDRLLVAKRKYPNMKFYYANVLNLSPFYGKGIKSIILSEILEHLKYEHCHFAIIHCLNVLDDNSRDGEKDYGEKGVIYYTVPNAYQDKTVDQNPEHKWYPTRNSINSIMEVVGKHIKIGYTVNEVGLFLCGTIWKV